jgi:hypothetical protein
MELGIVQSVFEILYGCRPGMTEEELNTEMQRRYAVAAGLSEHGAFDQAMLDALEGFDLSATAEENQIGREEREVAARSLCRLHQCNYIEVKILADRFLGELAIQWASERASDPLSSRRRRPLRLIGQ